MDNIFVAEPTAEEAANLQAAIQQNLAEIEQIRANMQRDQAHIEASGTRTDATLKQIQAQLALLKAN